MISLIRLCRQKWLSLHLRTEWSGSLLRPLLHCSAEKRQAALSAAVVTSVGAAMANPLLAEAAVTPTLKNLVSSVIAGAIVLGLIAVAVTAVSNFDPVRR